MAWFVLQRLLTLIATLLGASAVVFWVLEVLPGNAAQVLLGPDAAPEAVERRRDHDGPTHHRHERRRRRDSQRQRGRRAQQQRHPRRYSTGSHATPSMRATRSTAASRSG